MISLTISLWWRHNGRDSVSNHQPDDCLLNCLFRRRSKKTSKLRVTGLCAGSSPGTGEFPEEMASNMVNVSIWWRHHAYLYNFNINWHSLATSLTLFSSVALWSPTNFKTFTLIIIIPPAQRSCWGGYTGFTPSVRPSVCPACHVRSVTYIFFGWILFILGTNDHYDERVCRAPWPLTLTYIFKVIRPWLRKSCSLCSVYSSGWILFICSTNDHYH